MVQISTNRGAIRPHSCVANMFFLLNIGGSKYALPVDGRIVDATFIGAEGHLHLIIRVLRLTSHLILGHAEVPQHGVEPVIVWVQVVLYVLPCVGFPEEVLLEFADLGRFCGEYVHPNHVFQDDSFLSSRLPSKHQWGLQGASRAIIVQDRDCPCQEDVHLREALFVTDQKGPCRDVELPDVYSRTKRMEHWTVELFLLEQVSL